MTKFFILNPGDPVRVRLHTGEVVDAIYDGPCASKHKAHWVIIGDLDYIATRNTPKIVSRCRFIGPSCDLVLS